MNLKTLGFPQIVVAQYIMMRMMQTLTRAWA